MNAAKLKELQVRDTSSRIAGVYREVLICQASKSFRHADNFKFLLVRMIMCALCTNVVVSIPVLSVWTRIIGDHVMEGYRNPRDGHQSTSSRHFASATTNHQCFTMSCATVLKLPC